MKLLWWKSRTVQCVDCGYLSLARSGDAGFRELNENYRAEPRGGWNQPLLACSRGSWRLADEERLLKKESVDRDRSICIVMKKERRCPSWFPYQPSLTPKEHFVIERESRIARHTNFRSWVAIGISVAALAVAVVGAIVQLFS